MNPRKMQQMMKQMGIQQVEIPAQEVIIRTADKDLIIRNPSVIKVNMMGQESLQISGDIEEQERSPASAITADDIRTVMEQAKVNEKTARKALEDAKGDLAEAILNLSKSDE